MKQTENKASVWPGRIFAFIALLAWAVFIWLADHRSMSPEIFGRYSPEYMAFLAIVLAGTLLLTALAFFGQRRPDVLGALRFSAAAGLLLTSLVVALLSAEVLTRSFDLLGASLFEEVTRWILDLEADDALVYRQRAGLDTEYQGVPFRTNDLGLRERPVGPPDEDVFRILILGDSVTMGWGVRVENTFPRRLESLMQKSMGRPVQVINAGVSGYNTAQELAFLARHIESMAPDLVILVYVENDVEPQAENMVNMQERWGNPPGANALLLRWSWLYRVIYYVGPDLVGAGIVPVDNTEGLKRSMAALAATGRLAASHKIPFVVYLYRMTADIATDEMDLSIMQIAIQEDFPYIDTLDWFDGVNIRSVVNSFIDTHPNAEGHRIVAEGITDSLPRVIGSPAAAAQ